MLPQGRLFTPVPVGPVAVAESHFSVFAEVLREALSATQSIPAVGVNEVIHDGRGAKEGKACVGGVVGWVKRSGSQ